MIHPLDAAIANATRILHLSTVGESGGCVIPQRKRIASNDRAVELDKNGDNSVI